MQRSCIGANTVDQFLIRWSKIGSAGVGRVVTVASCGQSRMKIFVRREGLRDQTDPITWPLRYTSSPFALSLKNS